MAYRKYLETFPPLKVPYDKLRLVEIEIFSFCNRKCWFCPNSIVDRKSENRLMDKSVYENILKDLARINYSGIISYSRYNEPFACLEIFLERLELAKAYLPNCLLHTNSNGDFVTREALDKVYDAGLRSLSLQHYLKEDEVFDEEKIKGIIYSKARNLGLQNPNIRENPGYVDFKFPYKDMNLRIRARDFKANGTNRGGALKKIKSYKRTSPCHIPFVDMYIDYNGTYMPCCNLRSDIESHRKLAMGSVNEAPITSLFNHNNIVDFRKEIIKDNISVYPCNECNFYEDFRYGE